jgi:xanthine dehydrogenase accessory factor
MNSLQVLEAATRLQQQDQPFALVSVLRVQAPASARPGDKAVVTAEGIIHGWIGGGCAQPAVLRTVREALADGRARVIRIAPVPKDASADAQGQSDVDADSGFESDTTHNRPLTRGLTDRQRLDDILEFGMTCHSGGTLELFVDPVVARTQLTIIGDTPLAAALCELAPRVGLPVTLIAHHADANRFPAAQRVLTSDEDVHAASAQCPALDGGFIVVATQGRRDLQGLRLALALEARQTFFVASARKAQVLKQALIAAGEPASRVEAIIAPAGQLIGAQTPEEIALSVLAAVVAARRAQVPIEVEPEIDRALETEHPIRDSVEVACRTSQSIARAVAVPAADGAQVPDPIGTTVLPARAGGSCCGS